MRVLDLGGTVDFWTRSPFQPAEITVINLDDSSSSTDARIISLNGDACDASEVLSTAGRDTEFDLVFSNSLIEHVGGHERRCELARQIQSLAPCHWVQTPYRYFPLEPHWLFPGMQFLPAVARVRIAYRWPLAASRPATEHDAAVHALGTELLSATEMRFYFPDSEIWHERILGVTKSIVAVKTA